MASITNKVNTKVEVANELKSFIGGMNTYATDDKLAENECRLIQNMELDNYGTAEKRTGLVFDNQKSFEKTGTNSSYFQGAFDFVEIVDNAKTEIKIMVIAGKIYKKTANGITQLHAYIFDELTQKYNTKDITATNVIYTSGFNNGQDKTKTTFTIGDCRPVTATYSKGVLIIATGWKLLEYGLFDDKDITGNESATTQSYYLRTVKPRVPTEAQKSLYGNNLISLFSNAKDVANDLIYENNTISPVVVDYKFTIELLEYIGTPEIGYYKYVPALCIEPIINIGNNYRYKCYYRDVNNNVSDQYTNSSYGILTTSAENANYYVITNPNFVVDTYLNTSVVNNYNINYPISLETIESNVDNISSLTNKKWYYANLIDKKRYVFTFNSKNNVSFPSITAGSSYSFDQTTGVVTINNSEIENASGFSVGAKIIVYKYESLKFKTYSVTTDGTNWIGYETIFNIENNNFFEQADYEKYKVFGTENVSGLKYRCLSKLHSFDLSLGYKFAKTYETNSSFQTKLNSLGGSSNINNINIYDKLNELTNNSLIRTLTDDCNLILNYNNAILISGSTTDTNAYYQCYTDDYNYFPSTYVDAILGTYTTTITNLKSYRNGFLVFTDREIYYRTNVNPEQRNLKILNNTVGCISNFGTANIGNDCVFLSYDGLYRLYLTYGTISDNFNVKKIDLKISNIISDYINEKFTPYDLEQAFVTRYKNFIYVAFPNYKNENKTIIFKYNETNEAWTVDLIEECGNVLRIEDKNNYIEYICSKKEMLENKFDAVEYISQSNNSDLYDVGIGKIISKTTTTNDSRNWVYVATYKLNPNTTYFFKAKNTSETAVEIKNELLNEFYIGSDTNIDFSFTTTSSGLIGIKLTPTDSQVLELSDIIISLEDIDYVPYKANEYTKSFIQYTKEKIELLENQAMASSVLLDKNIFYSDGSVFDNNTYLGTLGTAYTSVVETANHKFDPYGNWYKKYYRWLINLSQDKKYYSKIYVTVYIDDIAVLKPVNFTTTYDKATNTVIYTTDNTKGTSYVFDKTLGRYIEAVSEDYNEAILTLRNNVIALPTDGSQMTVTEGTAGITGVTIEDGGAETHLTDDINNYGGHFDISAYEVANIDKFVANINETGVATRIRIEQTETQYFGVTSLAYVFKFDTDFKKW